ncbi:hypothetical protein T492DRAFT_547026 [Pavlovales sp. CCMP2436]|nr:hypothetical protein T492DRAFT_547026 [Pavlovales sp. CCMP2436]
MDRSLPRSFFSCCKVVRALMARRARAPGLCGVVACGAQAHMAFTGGMCAPRDRTDLEDITIYLNDLHILSTSSKPPTWSRPPRTPSNPPPMEREGHTAVVIGRSMVIFGGTWVDEDDASRYLNDVHCLDTGRNWWSRPDTLGTPPIEREGHSACAVGRSMLVFGGAGLDVEERSINLADLFILNTDTWTWQQPQLGSDVLPQERRYHTASVCDSKMYVFGGQYYESTADLHFECDNIVSCLDVENMSWETLNMSWETLSRIEGQAPLRRACHAAGVVGKNVYIVGGRYWDISEDDYIFMSDNSHNSPPPHKHTQRLHLHERHSAAGHFALLLLRTRLARLLQ